MNDQLKRIREKDYTQIDQKLFDNLMRADDLSSTLTHLTDFQNFLMQQITSMNSNDSRVKPNQLAKSIAKNFDNLKTSLVRSSRLNVRVSSNVCESLCATVQQLKKELSNLKKSVRQQIKRAVEKTTKISQNSLKEIVSKYQVQKSKNEQLIKQITALRKDKQTLIEQIQQLKTIEIKPVTISNQDTETYLESELFLTPLKQNQNQLPTVIHSVQQIKQDSWKLVRQKISSGLQQPSLLNQRYNSRQNDKQNGSRPSSLKRQTSNHQISRKDNTFLLKCKQNETAAILSKGVREESLRGRSKQKIKLFSMF